MTTTTRQIREMSFMIVESDIPPEMTIADYRRAREPKQRPGRRTRLAARLRLR